MGDVIDRDGFRANVGIVLMGEPGQLFLGRRSGGRGWQFPQGGMHRGESPEESLFRELREEIGLTEADVEIVGQTSHWLRYRLPPRYVRRDSRPLCIGQKQRWFLLRLARPDAEFRFDLTGEPEFDRWRWVDYWQPVREVIYFKRPVYVRALQELAEIVSPGAPPPYPAWWDRAPAANAPRRRRRPRARAGTAAAR
ncbi:MAG: RNA pyrophosphohydrolase [Proteobacteria bacterium]|nr:MAG: RNA pyrophosphohydrolase [Pseudomonadota bacterium]